MHRTRANIHSQSHTDTDTDATITTITNNSDRVSLSSPPRYKDDLSDYAEAEDQDDDDDDDDHDDEWTPQSDRQRSNRMSSLDRFGVRRRRQRQLVDSDSSSDNDSDCDLQLIMNRQDDAEKRVEKTKPKTISNYKRKRQIEIQTDGHNGNDAPSKKRKLIGKRGGDDTDGECIHDGDLYENAGVSINDPMFYGFTTKPPGIQIVTDNTGDQMWSFTFEPKKRKRKRKSKH